MLRDKTLIPLSHQHQRALALCVRIERASPIAEGDLSAWQTEIAQLWQMEIENHFAAEEQVVFPAAREYDALAPLVEELKADHAALRQGLERADTLSADSVLSVAQRLSAHIRKEERLLFERMQELMSRDKLDSVGGQLAQALKTGEQACIVPSAATKLRAASKRLP